MNPGAGGSGGAIAARFSNLLGDLGRIVKGSLAFLRYLLTADLVEIGLGQLSADSTGAVRGGQNRYLVTISNARNDSGDVTLIIDIYAVNSSNGPETHYARFSKRLKAAPGTSTAVEVRYDWLANACFVVDDLPFPPDDFWRGILDRSVRYSVTAVLLDPGGKRLDRLTVYQTLAP